MEKIWTKLSRIFKWPLLIIITISAFAAVTYMVNVYTLSQNSFNSMLWRQSIESQLKQQNDHYYNEIYDRYSQTHRDLNNYQYNTNQRLSSLENRVDSLEKTTKGIQITNTNTNTQSINGDDYED